MQTDEWNLVVKQQISDKLSIKRSWNKEGRKCDQFYRLNTQMQLVNFQINISCHTYLIIFVFGCLSWRPRNERNWGFCSLHCWTYKDCIDKSNPTKALFTLNQRNLKTEVSLWKRIKCFPSNATISGHFWIRKVIVSKNVRLQNVSLHTKQKSRGFQIPSLSRTFSKAPFLLKQ